MTTAGAKEPKEESVHVSDTWMELHRKGNWWLEVDDILQPINELKQATVFGRSQAKVVIIAPNGVRLHPSVWHMVEDLIS